MLILNTRYTFITDYVDFRDYIQHIKNNFTSDYANYADFQYQITHNFITLTTMILKTACKIVLSLTTLDYADIQYYMKNNPITDYANYTDFEYQI